MVCMWTPTLRQIQKSAGRGDKFADSPTTDIRDYFPKNKGHFVRNLKYMAKLADTYPNREMVQQVVAPFPVWQPEICGVKLL